MAKVIGRRTASGQTLMVRRRQRVRALRGPMTGSAPSRTMKAGRMAALEQRGQARGGAVLARSAAPSSSYPSPKLVHLRSRESRRGNKECPRPVVFQYLELSPWRDMNSSVNVPFNNFGAVVILIVVAFRPALPYLASQPRRRPAFDVEPCRWIAFPIVDRELWFGFDVFCAWQDVSLIPLMFFARPVRVRDIRKGRHWGRDANVSISQQT